MRSSLTAVTFLIQIILISFNATEADRNLTPSRINSRDKRALTFPRGAICGMQMAIAVPLDLPVLNVYMANNFEANYGLPTSSTDFTKGPAIYRVRKSINSDKETLMQVLKAQQFFTRMNIYRTIEDRLNMSRLPGKLCLLRAICEHASSSFSRHNGVLGDLMHIIFTPSTSSYEGGMKLYNRAEKLGRSEDCSKYQSECPIDVLSFISEIDGLFDK